jgi:hypothetical protein
LSSSEPQAVFGVVLFRSVHGALGAERILAAAGVLHKLIPVPRHLSSACGFCLRFQWADRERVEGLLPRDRLGVEAVALLAP